MVKEKLRSVISGLAVSLAATAVVLLVLEIGFRIVDPLKRRASAPQVEADMPDSVFREPFPKEPKPADEYRILALGDSFTWGDGVYDAEKIWPSDLQRMLAGSLKGKNIKVINLGIRGLTTLNEFELFAKVGYTLDPDLVIVEYLINDVLPSGPNLARVGEEWLSRSKRLNLIRNKKINDALIKWSYLYDFVNYRYLAMQRKIAGSMEWSELYRDDFPGWVACRKAIEGFGSYSRQKGVKVIMAVFPTFPGGKYASPEDFPDRALYEKVMDTARASGLYVIDLLPEYIKKDKDFGEWRVRPTDGHPDEEAHEIAASEISAFIKTKIFGGQ